MDIDAYIERYNLELGRNIYRHRERLGLSQQALADKAGVHRLTIGGIENMRKLPRLDSIVRIAYALGTSPEDLLCRWHFVPKEDALRAVDTAYWNDDLVGATRIINGEEEE